MLAIRNNKAAEARISARQMKRKESLTRGISCNLADLSDILKRSWDGLQQGRDPIWKSGLRWIQLAQF